MVELTARVAIESLLRATDDDATPIIRRLARIQARAFLDNAPTPPTETREAELHTEIERLRGLLIDPGDPAWEDARAVLVAELRKNGMETHADNIAVSHAVPIPSWIALNLIAHARIAPTPPTLSEDLRALVEQEAVDIITDLIGPVAASFGTNCRIVEDHLKQFARAALAQVKALSEIRTGRIPGTKENEDGRQDRNHAVGTQQSAGVADRSAGHDEECGRRCSGGGEISSLPEQVTDLGQCEGAAPLPTPEPVPATNQAGEVDEAGIANKAVMANLNEDGTCKYRSAQGYACAREAVRLTLVALGIPLDG